MRPVKYNKDVECMCIRIYCVKKRKIKIRRKRERRKNIKGFLRHLLIPDSMIPF